jgi:hypothetical protein
MYYFLLSLPNAHRAHKPVFPGATKIGSPNHLRPRKCYLDEFLTLTDRRATGLHRESAANWPVSNEIPLFLLFSAGNHQRETALRPHESSTFGEVVTEGTAGSQQILLTASPFSGVAILACTRIFVN